MASFLKKKLTIRKSVDLETSNELLDVLQSLLSPLASYRPHPRETTPRKRKRHKDTDDQHPLFVNPPPLISSLTIGFNDTTAHLESEIQGRTNQKMKAVFVARGDTSSTQFYAHFPLMVSMLPHVRFVSLAKGAEQRLCETLQLRRIGVVGLMVFPALER